MEQQSARPAAPERHAGKPEASAHEDSIETGFVVDDVMTDQAFTDATKAPVKSGQQQIQRILSLQHRIGNRGVQRLMQRMAGNSTNSIQINTTKATSQTAQRGQVVQRQVLANISLEDGTDVISDVIIGGRTPSPFTSTMGAHGTAWVAHIDQMRRVLIGRSLAVASQNLIDLAEEERTSDLLNLTDMVSEAQRGAINTAKQNVKDDSDALALVKNGGNHQAIIQAIRRLIDRHLTLVNYLPTATVQGGDPNGHGEGGARTNLNTFEYLYAKVATNVDITEEIASVSSSTFGKTLRAEATKKFAPKTDNFKFELRKQLWQLFAAETPTVFAQGAQANKQLQVWQKMLKNFLTTIRHAYPYAYQYTEMENPENQIRGLDYALLQTTLQPTATLLGQIYAAIRGNLDVTVAAPNAASVSDSDLSGATSNFQSSIFIGPDGKIGDVVLIGRTESPFSGTMGRHTTAWAAHVDALRNALIGKTLDEALDEMLERGTNLLSDESLSLSNLTDEKQQTKMAAWYDALKEETGNIRFDLKAIEEGDQAEFSPTELNDRIEGLILHYMSFMNLLPFSTVNHGSVPVGRNEGRHRQFLLSFEADSEKGVVIPNATKQLVLPNILGLWDGETLDDYEAPEDYDTDDLDVEEDHPLYDTFTDNDQDSSYADMKEKTFDRFKVTIQEAYPNAYTTSDLVNIDYDQAAELQYRYELRKMDNQKKRRGAKLVKKGRKKKTKNKPAPPLLLLHRRR